MHAAMNAAPLKRTLSVTGLLLTGAGCGVIAIKVVAPTFLSPAAASAQTPPSTDPPAPRPTIPGYHIPLTPKRVVPTTAPESAFSLPATRPGRVPRDGGTAPSTVTASASVADAERP